MKFNVTICLDRSGSMQSGRDDHEGGLRSFIEGQKKQEGETIFNLVQFDTFDSFEKVFDGVNIQDVDTSTVNLIPRGGTPLLDAVGKTIALIEEQEKTDKSDQVVLMIITDGEENSSREWTKENLKKVIEKHKNDWQILFLGANIDSFGEARSYGLNSVNAINFNNYESKSIIGAYNSLDNKMFKMRSSVASGCGKNEVLTCGIFTDLDYQAQNTYVDNSNGLKVTNGDSSKES